MRITCFIVLVLVGCKGEDSPNCEGSDPTGADGSKLIAGCPCSVDERVPRCCPGGESSFSCEYGVWRGAEDGCNPPCNDDGGPNSCSDPLPQNHVSCVPIP